MIAPTDTPAAPAAKGPLQSSFIRGVLYAAAAVILHGLGQVDVGALFGPEWAFLTPTVNNGALSLLGVLSMKNFIGDRVKRDPATGSAPIALPAILKALLGKSAAPLLAVALIGSGFMLTGCWTAAGVFRYDNGRADFLYFEGINGDAQRTDCPPELAQAPTTTPGAEDAVPAPPGCDVARGGTLSDNGKEVAAPAAQGVFGIFKALGAILFGG